MKPPLPAVVYGTGLLLAFGAGWFFKPAASPDTAAALSPPSLPAKRSGPPMPQKPTNAKVASGPNWLEAASADVAAIRAARQQGLVNQVLIDKLTTVLDLPDKFRRLSSWQGLIVEMRPDDVSAVQSLFDQRNKEGRYGHGMEQLSFLQHWGMIDGAKAAVSASARENIQIVMSGWAQKNSKQALAWLDSEAPALIYRQSLTGIIDGLFEVDPAAAEALLLARSEDSRLQDNLAGAVANRQAREGFDSARRWFAGIASGNASAAFKRENLSAMVSMNDSDELHRKQMVLDLVVSYQDESWLPPNAGEIIGDHWGSTDPATGFQQIIGMPSPSAREAAAAALSRNWAAHDPQAMSVWLAGNRSHRSFDQAASALAKSLQKGDPEAAQAWANQIKDPDLRSRAMEPQPDDPFATRE